MYVTVYKMKRASLDLDNDVFFILIKILMVKIDYPLPLTEFYEKLGIKRNHVRLTTKIRKILLENGISYEKEWVGTMKKITIDNNKLNKLLENTQQFNHFQNWRFKVNKLAYI